MSATNIESIYQEEIYALPAKVIVVLDKGWEEVTADERKLLSKILESVKLTLSGVQIIVEKEFDLTSLQAYAPKSIITFGAQHKDGGKRYEVHSVNGTAVLQADALGALDDQKKKSLWAALKQMFGL